MVKRGVVIYELLIEILISLFLIMGFLGANMTSFAIYEGDGYGLEFVSPTQVSNVSGNSIYVNLSALGINGNKYSFVDFNNSLIGFWRMDDVNGVVKDLSSYGNNGTLVSSPIFNRTNGYFGNGSRFDGLDDYINISDSASLGTISSNGEMTFCLWMNPKTSSSPYSTMTAPIGQWRTRIGSNLVEQRSWGLLEEYLTTNGKYSLAVSANGGSPYGTATTNSVIPLNQWTHVCGWYSNPNIKLFVNGIEQTITGSIAGIYNTPAPMTIGNYLYTAVDTRPSDIYFNGSVDEVVLFNRALAIEEIKAIYNASANQYQHNFTSLINGSYTFYGYSGNSSGDLVKISRTVATEISGGSDSVNLSLGNLSISFISPTPILNVSGNSIYVNTSTTGSERYSFVDFDRDLIGFWRMDSVNGDVIDESSYGNNGVINGAIINSSNGYFGNGSYFNGSSTIEFASSSNFDKVGISDKITLCSWININQHGSEYTGIVGRYNTYTSNNDRQFLLTRNSLDNKYGFLLSSAGITFDASVLTNSELSTGQWYHLCGTSNGTVKLYLNGVLQTQTATLSGGIKDIVNSSLFIGRFGRNNSFFNGKIDEVLLFNRDLSANEIKALYNSSLYNFEKNYTNLASGNHDFTGYAVNKTGGLVFNSKTISSGSQSGEAPILTLSSSTTQYNSFSIFINTSVGASMCWFTSNNGLTNITMFEDSTTRFYYEDFDYGSYTIKFYCQNTYGIGSLSNNFQFKRVYYTNDDYYTNSQGLKIYFDFGFNYTTEKGPLVIIPDSWTANKDTTWVLDAENFYIARGYTAVPVNTRGKSPSEGTKDAFGWECLDIYELKEYLLSNPAYNTYINNSVFYIAGASGAGGKAGVCSAKYPDTFTASYSSVGVLNLTRWWYTAGASDVSDITTRVGCTPSQCPEAYLSRDASYLVYNTQSSVMAVTNTDDERVTVNCSRDYNKSAIALGKTSSYIEYPTGGHNPSFTESQSWFANYTSPVFIQGVGDLRVGCYVQTKNFSFSLRTCNYTANLGYNISGATKTFNITTFGFSGNSSINLFKLSANTEYSVSINGTESILISESDGDLSFNVSLKSNNTVIILISPAGPYCGDGISNGGETCSSCPADVGVCPVTPPSGGSSSGGGGGGSSSSSAAQTEKLSISGISDIIARAGDKKTLSLNAKNIGKIFLNNCKLKVSGEISSWVYSTEISGIAPGENKNFVLDLNVPEGIEEKDYSGKIGINCDEGNIEQDIKISMPKGLQYIKIKEIKQDNGNLNVIYSYEGNPGKIDVEIWMLNQDNVEYERIKDSFSAEDSSVIERNAVINIPKDLTGIYSVNIALSSNLNNPVKQSVVLGKSSTTGFAVLDEPGNKLIAYVVFLLIIVGGVLFIVFGWNRKDKGIKTKIKVRR